MTTENPVEHAKYAVLNTPVLQYPYPHFGVRNVFPNNYYQDLITNLPEDKHYDKNEAAKKYSLRKVLLLNIEKIAGLPVEQNVFWSDFLQQFGSPNFMHSVLSCFGPSIAGRFRNRCSPRIMLCKDYKGFAIGPHTDGGHKLVSMIFYLPKGKSNEGIPGTSVVIPKESYQGSLSGDHRDWKDFINVKNAPFERNSMFCFFVADNSYHAVTEMTSDETRDSLQYFICAKETL